jgi:predicted dehydrogenase
METLNRYGYASMDQFRNWRWYERFGGGPLLSCGSHQIDVMNWAFESMPTHVYATGGADIYPQHECIDTALCTLEYELPGGKARTHYEVLSSSSLGGYFEKLTGPEGTLVISEFPPRGNFAVRENVAPEWEPFAQKGLLTLPVERPFQTPKGVVVVVSVSPDSGVLGWSIPVKMEEPLHLPHVRNFIDAIRKGHCVACSGETAYRALVVIARIRQSIEKQQRLRFSPREFVV